MKPKSVPAQKARATKKMTSSPFIVSSFGYTFLKISMVFRY